MLQSAIIIKRDRDILEDDDYILIRQVEVAHLDLNGLLMDSSILVILVALTPTDRRTLSELTRNGNDGPLVCNQLSVRRGPFSANGYQLTEL